jgi:hypothetical protein
MRFNHDRHEVAAVRFLECRCCRDEDERDDNWRDDINNMIVVAARACICAVLFQWIGFLRLLSHDSCSAGRTVSAIIDVSAVGFETRFQLGKAAVPPLAMSVGRCG